LNNLGIALTDNNQLLLGESFLRLSAALSNHKNYHEKGHAEFQLARSLEDNYKTGRLTAWFKKSATPPQATNSKARPIIAWPFSRKISAEISPRLKIHFSLPSLIYALAPTGNNWPTPFLISVATFLTGSGLMKRRVICGKGWKYNWHWRTKIRKYTGPIWPESIGS